MSSGRVGCRLAALAVSILTIFFFPAAEGCGAGTGDRASRVAKSIALAGRDRPGSSKFGGQPDELIGSGLAQPGSIRFVALAF
jgi:hypothetical protein